MSRESVQRISAEESTGVETMYFEPDAQRREFQARLKKVDAKSTKIEPERCGLKAKLVDIAARVAESVWRRHVASPMPWRASGRGRLRERRSSMWCSTYGELQRCELHSRMIDTAA